MKKSLYILLLSLLIINSVFARESVQLINYNDISIITSSGKKPTPAEVKNAIMQAAKTPLPSSGQQTWDIKEVAPGQLTGTLLVRNKHSVTIFISYNESKFSVVYKDSTNMHYGISNEAPSLYAPNNSMGTTSVAVPANASGPHNASLPAGVAVIHPYYNSWVRTLVNNIKIETQKL